MKEVLLKQKTSQLPVETEIFWHTLAIEEVTDHLQVDPLTGLNSEQVAERRQVRGPNCLAEKPPRSLWLLFLSQFANVLVMVLIFAAILAASIGNVKDAVVILVAVILNAAMGFSQESKAEKSLEVLRRMLPATARVRRGGRKEEIPAEDLVPGDIVLLEAGDKVPADGRDIHSAGLEVNESALTGEAQPGSKSPTELGQKETPLADRTNVVYMNTLVTRGRAEVIVTATGMQTEIGKISGELAGTVESPTPLQLQLDKLGKRLAILATSLVAVLFSISLMRGEKLVHATIDCIALAVAAMPEGLPVVVTVTLALGMRRMALERAVVKRLSGVETLGCTSVICSDKTGTLTMNQMTARSLYFRGESYSVSGVGYSTEGVISMKNAGALPDFAPLLQPAAACNDSRLRDGEVLGDPTEGALLALAAKGGFVRSTVTEALPRIAEIPFDSAHKFMATFHRDGDVVRMFVKGAPDFLLGNCTRVVGIHDDEPLDFSRRKMIDEAYCDMAKEGMRGLLIASRPLFAADFMPEEDLYRYVEELTFVALVGILDPPRPEAREAVALCGEAGIMVKMITGDHRQTASAIARDLGITGDAITGADLDGMDDQVLSGVIDQVGVFARVAPEHKVRIVKALKEKGHVVAMTGDGVNDAAALKNADIGIAMGIAGSDVTKEVATMVLTDDNFATIVGAVREGRTLYGNIVNFIRFQLTTTVGAVLCVFFAPLLGLPEPFNPIQILWVNMIMDGPPAVALALDIARPGIMKQPPRMATEQILTLHRMARVVFAGVVMVIGTLAVLFSSARNGSREYALTLTFTTFVFFQLFNVLNSRNETDSVLNRDFFANRMLWLAIVGVIAMQVVAVTWKPAQIIFHTMTLSLADWGLAVVVSASIIVVEEVRKWIARRP